MKLKQWYHKHHRPDISTEGIWYNQNNLYEVHYYPANSEKARIVGMYETLNEALIAKETYEQAMNDIKKLLKEIEEE